MSIAEKFEVIADEVYEKGKKDEHDKFWDCLQWNGNRTNYGDAFVGTNFGFDNFYPKYDIKPVGSAVRMMYNWRTGGTKPIYGSLKERLEECGVVLDTSKATNLTNAFAYATFTELPTIDLTGMTESVSGTFAYNYESFKTIEKIIVAESTRFNSNAFQSDGGLENITIEGTLGQSGFNVKDCKKLSVASLLSILTALSKDQSIASGKSVTFSTVHQSVIEGDADCLEQLNLAVAAGWTIAYA